jgi:hypothetical protein
MAAAINEFRIRLRAALWWLVPLLVAAALVAWETNFGRELRMSAPPEEPVAPRPVVTSLLPEYAIAGGTAALSDTVQRTLFNPTRRPAPVLLADSSKARLQRGQFALTGTMVIGGKNTAFLRETAGGKSRRVLQGDTVNGILVADVKPDRVRLALGDESEELVLRVVTNPRPTVQPAAPAPVAAAPTTPPAAAPAPVVPAQAGTAAQPAGTADGSLAERRRAARAAQAAVQSQTSTPDGNPIPPAAPAAAPSSPAAPAAAPAPGNAADPRWAEVYRAYQQPRTPNPTQR